MPAFLPHSLATYAKQIVLLGMTAFLPIIAQAQTPTWQAAEGVGVAQSAGASAQVYATLADGSGNVYVTGMFLGTVRFGTTTVTSAGAADAFVAKWNSTTNTFAWVLPFGGIGSDRSMALARNGNSVYAAGTFTGTSVVGGTTLSSTGQEDGFVVKLNDAGSSASVVWATSAGGSGNDSFNAVAASGSNVYLAGMFNNTAQLGSYSLSSSGGNDIMVAKLTDAGSSPSFTWAQRAGSPAIDIAQSIAVNGPNVYVSGYYGGPAANFGGLTLTNSSLSTIDGFVVKLTDAGSTGNFVWAQQASGPADDLIRGLAVSGNNVYAIGNFNSPTLNIGTSTLSSSGGFDGLVAKFVDAGSTSSFAWAYRFGGTGGESASSIAVAGSQVYLAGGFSSPTISFGTTTLANTNTFSDVYLARLTDAGASATFAYALSAGDAGDDYGIGVSVGGSRVYVGGSASSLARFGTQTLPPNTSGAPMGFVASLTDAVLGTTSSLLARGLEVYPNPAQHQATVQVPAIAGVAHASFSLVDALGRAVYTQRVLLAAPGVVVSVPLQGVAPGLYRVVVQAGSELASRTLLVN